MGVGGVVLGGVVHRQGQQALRVGFGPGAAVTARPLSPGKWICPLVGGPHGLRVSGSNPESVQNPRVGFLDGAEGAPLAGPVRACERPVATKGLLKVSGGAYASE